MPGSLELRGARSGRARAEAHDRAAPGKGETLLPAHAFIDHRVPMGTVHQLFYTAARARYELVVILRPEVLNRRSPRDKRRIAYKLQNR